MTYTEFAAKYHIALTEQQAQAVQTIDGPVLLLAVPGSGKTTVLVTRLGYMIYGCGISPDKILTVTYTVPATKDMELRFISLFGEELPILPEFRTINGICAKIIALYGAKLGKRSFDLVTDEKLINGMLSTIYKEIERDFPSENDLREIRRLITYIKNKMLSPAEIRKLGNESDYRLSDIYSAYNKMLRDRSLMDYDDQMVYAYTILQKVPEVLAHFRAQYPYICVDEAQDTSRIQHAIIALLAGENDNLFMVGDEDQSIYGFRAAYPEALLSFEQNHPGGNVLLMEQNFRSCPAIVSAADAFIQKNEYRHAKRMFAAKTDEGVISKIRLKTRKAQYSYLKKVAEDPNEKTAVLFRDNESVLPLIDLLEREHIPYRLRANDPSFFSHRIVNDIRDIILFAHNPKNTELFLRIYYKISTYLSKDNALRACEYAEDYDLPVIDAALRYCHLSAGIDKNLKTIRTHLNGLRSETALRAMIRITGYMGYAEYLERAKIDDRKIYTLRVLADPVDTTMGFVDRLDELRDIIVTHKNPDDCSFILSTIHGSKGLEYDTVYLLDLVDGTFPENPVSDRKKASADELQTYEEERRLFYVAATRAKKRLCIFHWGMKSTFLDEFVL